MITAVILCGGLGTRLRSVLEDRPKCLAPVLGRTYLDFLTDYLHARGVQDFVFATGHLHEQVEAWVQGASRTWSWRISREDRPLGTGGALRQAAAQVEYDQFLAFNGDTFLEVDAAELMERHRRAGAAVTLAAVRVPDTSAFGRIDVEDGRVCSFREKGVVGPGLINGGAYAIDRSIFAPDRGEAFSFEEDVLMQPGLKPAAHIVGGAFLDIGTPENLLLAGQVASRLSSAVT
jgi:D-glycero-alpha-D-manno-heptose 1-phosphate guanylyltransferase